jgi:hypothetical protein
MTGDGSDVFEGRLPRMVRTQLGELVQENGAEILQDPRRVRAMLGDTIATARREINLISLALTEGVPERLQAVGPDPVRLRAETAALIRQLERNHALHHDAAAWAVRSCAWSLGLDDPPEQFEPPPAIASDQMLPVAESQGTQPDPTTAAAVSVPIDAPGASQRPPAQNSAVATGAGSANAEGATTAASSDPWRRWALVAAALVLVVVVITAVTVVLTRDSGDTNQAGEGQPTGALTSPADPGTPSTPTPTHSPTNQPPVQVPTPFSSAALFTFAKPFFRPAQCFVPGPGEAPLAVRIRDKELIKCGHPGDLYTGTFWCKGAVPSFMADRRLFLSEREGSLRELRGKPAGSERPADGFQRAYRHINSAFPRVYWDSRDTLCAAEIQGNDGATMMGTIGFWRTGR